MTLAPVLGSEVQSDMSARRKDSLWLLMWSNAEQRVKAKVQVFTDTAVLISPVAAMSLCFRGLLSALWLVIKGTEGIAFVTNYDVLAHAFQRGTGEPVKPVDRGDFTSYYILRGKNTSELVHYISENV